MKKYIIVAIIAFAAGSFGLYFNQDKQIEISDRSLEKLEELNKKHDAISIRHLISQSGDMEEDTIIKDLQTSILRTNQKTPPTNKRLLIKVKDGKDDLNNIFELHLAQNAQDLEKIAREYEESIDEFEFVEPDYSIEISKFIFDENPQVETASIPGEKPIPVPRKPDPVIVAVIDTGIDINHKDLKSKVWSNDDEIRFNRIDDDFNKYTDDSYGWNFIRNTKNSFTDMNGHGTHIAGLVSRGANTKVMALKVIDNKEGNISSVIKAIKYAADNDADIINLSIGTTQESKSLKTAIKYADKKGLIMVAAAGNNGDSTRYYPAAFEEVVAVGATDENHKRLKRSNHGEWVDIYTIGQRVTSTLPNNVYGKKSGTSQAAAIVAGKIAELKARYPKRNNRMIKGHAIYLFKYQPDLALK